MQAGRKVVMSSLNKVTTYQMQNPQDMHQSYQGMTTFPQYPEQGIPVHGMTAFTQYPGEGMPVYPQYCGQGVAYFPYYLGVHVYPHIPLVPIYLQNPAIGVWKQYYGATQDAPSANFWPGLQPDSSSTQK